MPTIEFYKCPAFFLKSPPKGQIALFAQSPKLVNHDPALLVPLFSNKSLTEVLTAAEPQLAEVQFDDHRTFTWPDPPPIPGDLEPQYSRGCVHIADFHWKRTRLDSRVVWPPTTDGRDYEFKELVDIDGMSMPLKVKERYHGFHATMVQLEPDQYGIYVINGGISRLAPRPPNSTKFMAIAADEFAVHFHAQSSIKLDQPETWTGSVFIKESTWIKMGLSVPKLPPGFAK